MSDSYLDYWEVTEPIFTVPVSKEHMYCSQSMQLIRQQLLAYFSKPGSLTLVTAPAGYGKSTLAKWVYDSLSFAQWEVLLINLIRDHQEEGWLLKRLSEFLGAPPHEDRNQVIQTVLSQLDGVVEEQRRLLVLVDSAERLMTSAAFNEIHALLSMQKMGKACLSFLVLGRDNLRHVLSSSPETAALVTRNFRLPALGKNEVQEYIEQRIKVAGLKPNPFSAEAIAAIYAKSEGVFAKVAHLAESCLIDAFINRTKNIDASLVENAEALENKNKLDSDFVPPPQEPRKETPVASSKQKTESAGGEEQLTLDALLKKSS